MTDYLQVITTVDDKDAAARIAEYVIERKLAACVQISTCRSIYRWQGRVEEADEYLCTIKTRTQLYSELEHAIKHVHPYDVPEILATVISHGNQKYLEWIDQEVRGDFGHDEGV